MLFIFLAVPWFGLHCVIVVFPDHNHLLFLILIKLYQATRLENLVQLFNAESHAIGIKPVHGIDDAIAKYVFDKFVEKKMEMYMSLIILTQNDSYKFHTILLLC